LSLSVQKRPSLQETCWLKALVGQAGPGAGAVLAIVALRSAAGRHVVLLGLKLIGGTVRGGCRQNSVSSQAPASPDAAACRPS